jgi:hypothetical protein
MHTFILQDYTTIRGISGGTVIQNESGWLDLSAYEDLVVWTDIRETSGGTITLDFMTSPTKDESLFTNMISSITFGTGVASIRQDKILMSSATVPVARYVRWRLLGPAAAWDVTFRVYVSANSPGM